MISGCYNSQKTLTSTGGYLLVMSILDNDDDDDWVFSVNQLCEGNTCFIP